MASRQFFSRPNLGNIKEPEVEVGWKTPDLLMSQLESKTRGRGGNETSFLEKKIIKQVSSAGTGVKENIRL